MLRKLVLAASAAALMGAAFFGASWARASSSAPPNLPSSLPASDLPTVQVPRADVLAINNIISAEDAARYGITPGSFTNARELSKTALGSLYVIPGSSGICLALAKTVGCTDDFSADSPAVVALFVSNHGSSLVGGGLLRAGARPVSLVIDDGSRIRATPTQGGFIVTPAQGVRAHHLDGLAAG